MRLIENMCLPSLFAFFVCLAAFSNVSAVENAGNVTDQPQFVIPLDTHRKQVYVGVAKPDVVLPFSLALKNNSSSPLTIEEATVSCRCVKVSAGTSVVDPGFASTMAIAVSSGPRSGRKQQSITVISRDQAGQKIETRIEVVYEVVGSFELAITDNRWVIDKNSCLPHSFRFTLRGFRDFDLTNVSLSISGAEVEIQRESSSPIGSETSREICTVALNAAEDISTSRQLILIAANKSTGNEPQILQERIVLIPREIATVSPNRPREIDGKIVMFVRLIDAPEEEPKFQLIRGGNTHGPAAIQAMNPRLYRLEFSPDELLREPIANSALEVKIGKKTISLPLSNIEFPGKTP